MLNCTRIPKEMYTISVQTLMEKIMIDFINFLYLIPLELK